VTVEGRAKASLKDNLDLIKNSRGKKRGGDKKEGIVISDGERQKRETFDR